MTRAALLLALLAGCAGQAEQCLVTADAHKDVNAHKLCHGYTWAACPPEQKQAVIGAYETEQELCRPADLDGGQ